MKPPSENQPQEVLAGLVGELHVPSAYGASIHKSQRSEYPAVVIPVMTQHYAMLQGNLLTASRSCGARLRTSAIGKYASSRPRMSRASCVHDHLVWVEPISGMAFPSTEDEANLGTAAPQNAVH
jgi:hypothetical protein